MAERITLQKILEAYEQDRLSKDDFIELTDKLAETLEGRMKSDKGDLDNSMVEIANNFATLKAEIEARTEQLKGELSNTEKAFLTRLEAKISQIEGAVNAAITSMEEMHGKMMREQENGMKFVYDKVGSLKNGDNGKDADSKEITRQIIAELWPKIQEEIKKEAPQRVLGGMGSSRFFGPSVVVKSLYNQSFEETPNGIITEFHMVKAPRTPGAERIYQNRTRCHPGASNDYTVSGKVVTFNVAPLTGDVLNYDLEY